MIKVIFLANDKYMVCTDLDSIVISYEDLPKIVNRFKALLKPAQWSRIKKEME